MESLFDKCLEKTRLYQAKESQITTLDEQRRTIQSQLDQVETNLKEAKTECKEMVENSELPILIYSLTSRETCSVDDSVSWTTTTNTYYLLDLDTIVRPSLDMNRATPRGEALDLTNVPSFQGISWKQITEHIKTTAKAMIDQYKPETWQELKDLIGKYYLPPKDD